METYWFSFHIENDSTYQQRYDRLIESIRDKLNGKWWLETTSFIIFQSNSNIDTIALAVKAAFNPNKDIAVIGMSDYKSARLIGASKDPDIYDLMPFIKKV